MQWFQNNTVYNTLLYSSIYCVKLNTVMYICRKGKAARVIGLLSYNTADVEETVHLSEVNFL